MRERPILFSAPMVRALLAGTKTQTRREISAREWQAAGVAAHAQHIDVDRGAVMYSDNDGEHTARFPQCRFGECGDRLWVKETFFDARPWRHEPLFGGVCGDFIYRAEYEYRETGSRRDKVIGCHHWKPSIFMRRVESRLLLGLTEVRVERLQAISEANAISEGVDEFADGAGYTIPLGSGRPSAWQRNPEDAYRVLWEKLNGAGSWAANPWVWVLTFKRVEARS